MNKYLTMSAAELAEAIRKKEVTVTEVVETHIRRIEEVNPKLNAVIETRYDEARREARAADERMVRNPEGLPPLFGVPCTIKDSFAMKGFHWAVGIWARKDLIADFTATNVERLQKAGAIILGRTNVPEGCMWCETYNTIYGRTNNPYDLNRTVGGSSGGEGCIVGAGASPFGLGADVGGSIRYPSAFNGVAGHKPTGGLVPGTGNDPKAEGPLARYCTCGPLARKVKDLKLIMPIIAGPDGKDLSVIDRPMKNPDDVDVKKVKVYFYDSIGISKPGADMKRAVKFASDALAEKGLTVEYWRPEGIAQGINIWQAAMAQNPHPYVDILGHGKPISLSKETLKMITGQSKLTLIALVTALIEKPGQMMKKSNAKFIKLGEELQKRIEDKLGDDGVILTPVFPVVAPKHNRIWFDILGLGYTCIYNIMEFPSTIVPIYHRSDGVPVSLQVLSRRFNDHVTLAVGELLENIFGGWKPPENL